MSSPCHVKPSREPQDFKTQPGPTTVLPDPTLSTAIESASHAQLCLVLRQLCSYSKTATDIATKHLISTTALEGKEKKKETSPEQTFPRSILKKTSSFGRSSQTTQKSSPVEIASSLTKPSPRSPQKQHHEDPPSSNNKRKPQTQCRNCGSEYSASATSIVEPCVHHPGKREVNNTHPVWDDFDPDVLGDAWTLMEYEDFASGFQWSCCEREVGDVGCVVGRHEAAPAREWKRGRI